MVAGSFRMCCALCRRLQLNAENYDYHRGLQCAILNRPDLLSLKGCVTPVEYIRTQLEGESTGDEAIARMLSVYQDLAKAQPRCRAHQRIPLDFLPAQHPAFLQRLDEYMRSNLRRGVPSLAAELKPLYRDSAKVALIDERIKAYLAAARTNTALPAVDGADAFAKLTPSGERRPGEAPSTLVWVLSLAAAHEDRMGRFEAGITLMKEALVHSPTVIEAYMLLAKLLKHAGEVTAAAEVMDAGRKLDLADRYVNNKATKYLLRAGKIDDGMARIGMFARQEMDPTEYLRDMQVAWYQLEVAQAYRRAGDFGLALKRFALVQKYFDVWTDDQTDFHGYCMRRMTLRPYIDVRGQTCGYLPLN